MRLFGSRPPKPVLHASMLSDRGQVHELNQDACLVDSERGLFAVADGVGGQPAGDVAARVAVERLPSLIDHALGRSNDDTDSAIEQVVVDLSDVVQAEAESAPELTGMATTVVIVLIEGGTAHIAHVGDSRAYLVRGGRLRQLTDDHSLAAELVESGVIDADEASTHPLAHSITQAIGLSVQPAVRQLDLLASDRLLLCTDGLSDMVADDRIAAILADDTDPAAACQSLVDAANAAGGKDNVSVVVVDVATSPA